MLKNNEERRKFIQNEDNYHITYENDYLQIWESDPLPNGDVMVILKLYQNAYHYDAVTNSSGYINQWKIQDRYIKHIKDNEVILSDRISISGLIEHIKGIKV